MKNFSSLRAILSALQCNAIHRLKRTWEEVSRYVSALKEIKGPLICKIFSVNLTECISVNSPVR